MCRVPEEVPEEVAQLMNECLAYDPKERPSAKEIYDRLSAAQNVGSEGSSGPQAPQEPTTATFLQQRLFSTAVCSAASAPGHGSWERPGAAAAG